MGANPVGDATSLVKCLGKKQGGCPYGQKLKHIGSSDLSLKYRGIVARKIVNCLKLFQTSVLGRIPRFAEMIGVFRNYVTTRMAGFHGSNIIS